MSTTIYFVSGANRGIGLGFVTHILKTHSSAFVYAGVREPGSATALQDLDKEFSGRVSIVKCVSGDVEGNAAMAKEIEKRHGRLDTVIANAGMGSSMANVADVSAGVLEEHLHVNVTGPVVLFQAVRALLQKSSAPRFVPITSSGGQLDGRLVRLPTTGGVAYGASKAALNWVTRKIHFENEWLVAFPLSPGPVDTDMLKSSMRMDASGFFASLAANGIKVPTVETVTAALLAIVDAATREKEGGEFMHVDGTRLPW